MPSTKILIIGAGGHAQVVAEILFLRYQMGEDIQPIGYLDDNPQLLGKKLLNLPVLGKIDQLAEIDHDQIIIAIGHNATRQNLFDKLHSQGTQFAVAIHPHTTISSTVKVGKGSMVCAGVIINPQAVIGQNVILNTGCTIDHHNQIGNHSHIAPGVHIGGDVKVEEGAFLGIGANILPQRQIGAWSTIAAGATIITDVEAHSLYIGTPAKRRP
jgi:sugar O-acyltransferase (sialic acid O-acetyltransferase NeuD family)